MNIDFRIVNEGYATYAVTEDGFTVLSGVTRDEAEQYINDRESDIIPRGLLDSYKDTAGW